MQVITLHVYGVGVPIALFGGLPTHTVPLIKLHHVLRNFILERFGSFGGALWYTTIVPLLNMIFKLRTVLGFGTVLVPCLVCLWTAQDTKNKFYSSFSIIKTILLNSKTELIRNIFYVKIVVFYSCKLQAVLKFVAPRYFVHCGTWHTSLAALLTHTSLPSLLPIWFGKSTVKVCDRKLNIIIQLSTITLKQFFRASFIVLFLHLFVD